MIITHRAASISFTTDPVAANVRRSISAGDARLLAAAPAAGRNGAPLDLVRLYPALFTRVARPQAAPARALRGLALRLSVIGTVALTMFALHH